MDRQNVNFRLLVMGQSFKRQPEIFEEARGKLAHRLDHFGYVESRKEYIRKLCGADIVVSTATHEFYGISVIEAVRTGGVPLLPNRLSYPELFPEEYLYEDGELFSRLKWLLQNYALLKPFRANALTKKFSWPVLKEKYIRWFEGKSL